MIKVPFITTMGDGKVKFVLDKKLSAKTLIDLCFLFI